VDLTHTIAALQREIHASTGAVVRIATAESATAGRIADRLTEVPGASDYVVGGCVVYSNEAKRRLLGVSEATLAAHGAVSEEVAREMAEGGRLALGADVCVADTGIAGPGGATAMKPVGLFFLALATPSGCSVSRFAYSGDREANKEAATQSALSLLRDYLVQCCHSQGANDHGSL
jgi:PncC family amidohydrolase